MMKKIDTALHHKEVSSIQVNDIFNEYVNTVTENLTNFHYNFEPSAYEEVLSNILKLDDSLNHALTDDIFKNFFNVHIDLIYDRINLMEYNSLPLLNKLKGIYSNHYAIALNLKSIIEKTYNINLSDTEMLFLVILVLYCNK